MGWVVELGLGLGLETIYNGEKVKDVGHLIDSKMNSDEYK